MANEGLNNSLFDISQINDKMYHIYRKITPIKKYDDLRYHWSSMYNKPWNRHCYDMLKLMYKANLPERIFVERPSLILSIENEYISWNMLKMIEQFYGAGSLPAPKRHFYHRFINYYRHWTEEKMDYVYYTIPYEAPTYQYSFPGHYVGQYGVYESMRELLSRDPNSKNLIKENSIYLIRKNNPTYTEHIISKIRDQYRAKNNIPDDAILLFVNPGNLRSEAEFCLEQVRLGINEFSQKYFSPTSLEPRALPKTHLVTVMPIQKGSIFKNCEKEKVHLKIL